jgi:hypothetical protein
MHFSWTNVFLPFLVHKIDYFSSWFVLVNYVSCDVGLTRGEQGGKYPSPKYLFYLRIHTHTHTRVWYATTNDPTKNECYNEQFSSIKSECYNERLGIL